jgi:anti-sigma regulatory factor (Ser/Thr protein kinase)
MESSTRGSPAGTGSLRRTDAGWHEAVPCSSPADLAAQLAPRVMAAVTARDPVVAVLADDARAELSAVLGGGADAVDFQDPREVHDVPGFTVAVRWARTSRRIVNPGGRALVIGQQLDELPGCGPEHWARLDIGLDVAIVGLPVTVLCPFPEDSPELGRVHATHPVLATADGYAPSPGYRPPLEAVVDHPPPPPPDLGPPAAELAFGADELMELRHLVAAVATRHGLGSERVADLVLAVNELASNSVEHGPGSGRLRIWTGNGVVAEVADSGRMDVPFPGLALPPPEGVRGRGLWLASELCDVLQVWSTADGTVLRVRASD